MVVLGVDPGVRVAGYAVFSCRHRQYSVETYGAVHLARKYHLSSRVGMLYECLSEIIHAFHVTHISLETPFLGKNTQNFLKLGYVRGVLYLLAHQYGATLYEFSPRQIKQAVTGFGGARKEQVARMVYALCPQVAHAQKHDVTDALAIGLGACMYFT